MAAYQSELAVITKAKDLCSYVMTVTDKSPKRFRFTLVAKLQNYALNIIENLYRANEVCQFHLVVHVCIFNSAGEMLIQQRQPFKKGWPNMWDISVGGSALSGESSRDAAMRETHEELGIVLNLHGMRPKFTINFEQGFDDFYLIRLDADIDNLVLQEDEVQAVKWASVNDILQMIDEGTFIPYYKNLIRYLFDTRDGYGCQP